MLAGYISDPSSGQAQLSLIDGEVVQPGPPFPSSTTLDSTSLSRTSPKENGYRSLHASSTQSKHEMSQSSSSSATKIATASRRLASKCHSATRSVTSSPSRSWHGELFRTREVTSLHLVLRRLEVEVSKPGSILTRSDDSLDRKEELAQLSGDCMRRLKILDDVLEKYSGLSEDKRGVTRLWQKAKFGNGEILDIAEIILKVSASTSTLTLFLILLSIGSQGKVESYMESQGDELRKMRRSLNWIAASMQAKALREGEGSILTTYSGDDKTFWKELRRELIKEGFSSDALQKHKEIIKEYVLELGNRGALDDIEAGNEDGYISFYSASGSDNFESLIREDPVDGQHWWSTEESEEDWKQCPEQESEEKSLQRDKEEPGWEGPTQSSGTLCCPFEALDVSHTHNEAARHFIEVLEDLRNSNALSKWLGPYKNHKPYRKHWGKLRFRTLILLFHDDNRLNNWAHGRPVYHYVLHPLCNWMLAATEIYD
jgi:hypothetical protein